MAGDPKNTNLWTGADVYISFTEGTEGPNDLTSPWPEPWKAAGLLDGEEGFTQAREEESAEHYAWGGILHKRTKSKHKRTFRFVALEDNEVTFRLVNPGSERTTDGQGARVAAIKVPTNQRISVGFELRDGEKVKRRYALSAEVTNVAEIKDAENEPTVYDVTVLIFPEADGTLFHEIDTDPDYVDDGIGGGVEG